MSNERNIYYSLRLRDSSDNHPKGYELNNKREVLNIGETTDCHIRYEKQSEQYVPEYYATILPNDDGESWRIVKRSPHIDVNIAGQGGFAYACNLLDGDVITIGPKKKELVFHVHRDVRYSSTGIEEAKHSNKRLLIAMGIVLPLLLLLGVYWCYQQIPKPLQEAEVRQLFANSIYIIKVDSVEYAQITEQKDSILGVISFEEESPIIGTAFLTKDSLLVTARHCVEYWVAEKVGPTTRIDEMADEDVVRWALLAETFNHENYGHKDSIQQLLRAYCSVYPQSDIAMQYTPVFRFVSTADSVYMDKERDAIIPIGEYGSYHYYWRTVAPLFSRRDMELGDWVSVRVHQAGTIQLADSALFAQMKENETLAFMGLIESEQGTRFDVTMGKLMMWDSDKAGLVNLAHTGDLTHGSSGSPAIVKKDNSYFAVGIVSKIDSVNVHLKESVPVTVLKRR